MTNKIVSCPFCGQKYSEEKGPLCNCQDYINAVKKKWEALLTHKCLNCLKPLGRPALFDLSKLDIRRCEETKPNEKCYITGIICKNVKLGDQNCRTLKIDDTWRHEVARLRKQGKIVDKYTKKDGTFNQRKFNHFGLYSPPLAA